MRKVMVYIHLILSLPAGIILMIICFTGAILVFEEEIKQLSHPEWFFVEKGAQKLSADELVEQVNNKLEKGNTVAAIQLFSNPERTAVASLKEGSRVSAYVNPYTGQVTGTAVYRESFFFKIFSLHRWLMDGSRTTGKYVVGVSTLFFVFILISGFFIWIPRRKKQIKYAFTFKSNSLLGRRLFDWHRVGGLYACFILLVLALTGLMWSFDWYRKPVGRLFNIEMSDTKKGRHFSADKTPASVDRNVSWQQVVETIQTLVPNYEYITVSDKTVTVLPLDAPHKRATNQYTYAAETGKILKVDYYKDAGQRKLMGWVYVLHVGSWGGWVTKTFTFLASLCGFMLPVTGYWLFIRKRIRKRKRDLRK